MPPPLLIESDRFTNVKDLYTHEEIYALMPHKHEFALLDGVSLFDRDIGIAVAYHECKSDGWWVRAHVPGRPIFPGVLQLECSAQLIAFYSRYADGCDGFIVFSGVEGCRFREAVIPPCRLYILAQMIEDRPRRVKANVQGIVDGRIVFQAVVAGMQVG
ncbi:MAG: beta-hydroxyacyl-ACP dehydratase [Planctomycetes bacterium]|nr:beta-hydroxyacyl-ACP dehydratase [Planctomycetota bacterium]